MTGAVQSRGAVVAVWLLGGVKGSHGEGEERPPQSVSGAGQRQRTVAEAAPLSADDVV